AFTSQTSFNALVTDLGDGGSRSNVAGIGSVAFRISRPGSYLNVALQQTTLRASAPVNPASGTVGIAAGGLATISGTGLARSGAQTAVTIGGRTATVVFSTA